MFSDYFAPDPDYLTPAETQARRQRRREVENALLGHLVSGFKPTAEAMFALQEYIDGVKSRERAFGVLYEMH